MITVSGLTKSFGGRTLFEDVTFKLVPGRRVALVGGNGVGKTTLLEIIVGDQQPDAGEVHIGQGHPDRLPAPGADRADRRLGHRRGAARRRARDRPGGAAGPAGRGRRRHRVPTAPTPMPTATSVRSRPTARPSTGSRRWAATASRPRPAGCWPVWASRDDRHGPTGRRSSRAAGACGSRWPG